MRVRSTALVWGITAACAFGAAHTAQADSGKDFFNGKTVEWIVTTAPGGGHDFWGRLMAQYMEPLLPGSKFVVVNRPGAGHIIGANLIYNAKPDGLTVGNFSTGLVFSQLLKRKGIQFDLTKMSWLGKLTSEPRTMTTGIDSDYKTFEDVLKSKRLVRFSASGVGSGSYTDSFLIATAFGIPHKIITGYSGSQATLAMMRGEIDVLMGGEDSAQAYARAGRVRILMEVGGTLPGIPDARDYAKSPQARAVMELMTDMSRLSRITAGPPGIPADRLAALRAAFKGAVGSEGFRTAAAKAKRPLDPAYGETVHKLVVKLMHQPPEVIALMKKLDHVKVDMVQNVGTVSRTERGGRTVYIRNGEQEFGAKVSGSRTLVMIDGKKAKRKAIAVGMTCTFTYPRPGAEAKRIDCKQ